jgi:chemotaxis signal transduction protein
MSEPTSFAPKAPGFPAGPASELGHGDGRLSLVQVECGGRTCFLEPGNLFRVERTETLQRNPRGHDPVGWLLDADAEIPVHSLAERLSGRAAPGNPAGPVLVLSSAQGLWGLMVERLTRREVERRQILPFPALPGNGHSGPRSETPPYAGVVRVADEIHLLLDAGRLAPRPPAAPTDREAYEGAARRSVASVPRRSDRPAAPPMARSREAGQVLAFSAGLAKLNGRPVRFALSVSQLAEVIGEARYTEVPGAAPFLLGLYLWRDRALPVVDLAAAVGLPPRQRANPGRLLICRANGSGELLGLEVDRSLTLRKLPLENQPYHGPLPFASERILGCFELPEELLAIPDLAGLMA